MTEGFMVVCLVIGFAASYTIALTLLLIALGVIEKPIS